MVLGKVGGWQQRKRWKIRVLLLLGQYFEQLSIKDFSLFLIGYTDDRRVKLIIHQLHGVGKSWWVATKKALENQGTVITWTVFRTAFYQRFFPVSYRKDKGAEFAKLRQGQLNIEEYVEKFTSLLKFSPHVAISDEAQADQFINGLNPDVFTLVNTGRPNLKTR
ncbi:Pol polyprotein [Dorcoceras hygrometricum]|nr:Pol polyprotein [Dorcoceras hygrometricum]